MSWFRSLLLSALADGEVLVRRGKGFDGAEISTLTPAGHWLPDATATRDLGSTSVRWRSAYLSTSVDVQTDDATVAAVTRGLTLSHTTSATAQAGVGAGLLLRAESAAGTLRSAGAVDAIHTDVTNGAELSALILSAGIAGTLFEVARLAAVASAVNGLSITASATGQPVRLDARGSDTNVSAVLRGQGAGRAGLAAGSGDNALSVSTSGIYIDSGTVLTPAPAVSRNSGVVRVPSGSTSVTVTNTLCTADSLIHATIRNTLTNNVSVRSVVPGAGSFVITLSGDPGASHADVAFVMFQPDV